MFLADHCKDCKKLLGDAHQDVNLFIDKMVTEFPVHMFGEYHRTFLHNTYGLTVIYNKFGVRGHKAGLIHLHADYLEHTVGHMELKTVLKRAQNNMPWWDHCEYVDEVTLEMATGGF